MSITDSFAAVKRARPAQDQDSLAGEVFRVAFEYSSHQPRPEHSTRDSEGHEQAITAGVRTRMNMYYNTDSPELKEYILERQQLHNAHLLLTASRRAADSAEIARRQTMLEQAKMVRQTTDVSPVKSSNTRKRSGQTQISDWFTTDADF